MGGAARAAMTEFREGSVEPRGVLAGECVARHEASRRRGSVAGVERDHSEFVKLRFSHANNLLPGRSVVVCSGEFC